MEVLKYTLAGILIGILGIFSNRAQGQNQEEEKTEETHISIYIHTDENGEKQEFNFETDDLADLEEVKQMLEEKGIELDAIMNNAEGDLSTYEIKLDNMGDILLNMGKDVEEMEIMLEKLEGDIAKYEYSFDTEVDANGNVRAYSWSHEGEDFDWDQIFSQFSHMAFEGKTEEEWKELSEQLQLELEEIVQIEDGKVIVITGDEEIEIDIPSGEGEENVKVFTQVIVMQEIIVEDWTEDEMAELKSTGVINSESSDLEMNVYPNPNQGSFEIDYKPLKGVKPMINIYDLQGSNVYSKSERSNKGKASVELPDLAEGVYVLEMIQGDKVDYQKIVIQ